MAHATTAVSNHLAQRGFQIQVTSGTEGPFVHAQKAGRRMVIHVTSGDAGAIRTDASMTSMEDGATLSDSEDPARQTSVLQGLLAAAHAEQAEAWLATVCLPPLGAIVWHQVD